MLKIAVVEDQQEVRDELCRFIRQYAAENSLQVEVLPIEDGAVIAEHYEPGYDIIFMDVEMPGLDGFGAAEKIRAVDADAVLVFVTNMAQYAIKGYEVDALDYVLKPVNYYQFCTKLSRAVQRDARRYDGGFTMSLFITQDYIRSGTSIPSKAMPLLIIFATFLASIRRTAFSLAPSAFSML